MFFAKTQGTDAVFSGQLRSCQYGRRPRTMHGYPAKDVQIMFDRRPKTRCECQILIGNVEKKKFIITLTTHFSSTKLRPIIVYIREMKCLD